MTQGKNMVFAAFVVLQAIFYGADNVVMKVAYGEISPLWCQTLRFGLAFALFMALFGKQIVKGLRGSRVSAWLPVGVVYAVAFVASSLAVDMTSATNAGFFISLPMLFTPVIALALMRRTYRLSTLVLQIAVLAGLYLLCCNGGSFSFGAGVILVAVVGATLVEGCDGNSEAPSSAGMERLVSQLASDSNA